MATLGDTALVVRWFQEVWNNGSEAAIDELAASDVQFHSLRGGFLGTDDFSDSTSSTPSAWMTSKPSIAR